MVGIGQVEVTSVNVNPTEVKPGGETEITVTLTETAEFVGPFGQLRLCNPDGLNTTGLEVETILQPSWRSDLSRTVCLGVSNIGSVEMDIVYTLTAPESQGQYDVDALIRSTKNNNNESNTIDNTITVSTGEGATDDPRDEDERENDGGDNDGDEGGKFIEFALQNPGAAAALAGGAAIAISTFTSSLTE